VELIGGEQRKKVEIVPGARPKELSVEPAPGGLVHESERFVVRAVALAHHDIASFAYEIEERERLAVRPEALAALGATPGAWLDRLKHLVAEGKEDEPVEVVPGVVRRAAELARELLVERPGQRIVYVTDAADSEENRRRIIGLARGADLFICE